MAHRPTPILVVSSSTNRGEVFKTFDALAAGAVDVLEKPSGQDADGVWEARFISTVKLVSRIRVITHPRARLGALGRPGGQAKTAVAPVLDSPRRTGILAIGASTGGPGALVEILSALPPRLPVPVLLVLHISEPFGLAFADWLGSQTGHIVVCARDGEPLKSAAGQVLVAPPDRHLVVRGGRVQLTSGPERHSCRPSVDVLFESVAEEYGAGAAGCLLTGMGRDGAVGLLAIRRAGGLTVAQDEATSIVYGMPREAVLIGAAERILPLGQIGPALAALCFERP